MERETTIRAKNDEDTLNLGVFADMSRLTPTFFGSFLLTLLIL